MMGIAAALLIMVAGTMIWQSASFSNINGAPDTLNVQQANYYNRVSNFVIDEHARCCDEKTAKVKFIEHDINEAVAYFSDLFGAQVIIPDMGIDASTIEFYGGGDCHYIVTATAVVIVCCIVGAVKAAYICDPRFAVGEGAGFIEGDGCDISHAVELCATFNQYT